MEYFEKFGGRKFILSIIGLTVFTILAVVKPEAITTEFLTGVLGIIGAFSAANVINTKKAPDDNLTSADTSSSIAEEIKLNKLDTERMIEEQNKLLTNYGDNIRAHENAINRLLDLIQSKLPLTQAKPNGNINTQQQVVESSGQNAQQNREAINQYLTQNF